MSLYDVDRLDEEPGHGFVRRLAYRVVRPADQAFEKAGGGTRHWVRDHFLPLLAAEGLEIVVEADRVDEERRAYLVSFLRGIAGAVDDGQVGLEHRRLLVNGDLLREAAGMLEARRDA